MSVFNITSSPPSQEVGYLSSMAWHLSGTKFMSGHKDGTVLQFAVETEKEEEHVISEKKFFGMLYPFCSRQSILEHVDMCSVCAGLVCVCWTGVCVLDWCVCAGLVCVLDWCVCWTGVCAGLVCVLDWCVCAGLVCVLDWCVCDLYSFTFRLQ